MGAEESRTSVRRRHIGCLACLCAAGCYEVLLTLLERAPFKWWRDQRWGVKALVAMVQRDEALRYAEDARGLNDPGWLIAQACEAILLDSGLKDEAYRRYAIEANQGTTHLATFRAIAKKYPDVPKEKILRDLVASAPCSARASGSPRSRTPGCSRWRPSWPDTGRPTRATMLESRIAVV